MNSSTVPYNSYTIGGGYTCTCGQFVAYGTPHTCRNLTSVASVMPQPWLCGGCGQYIWSGMHNCTGWGMAVWPPKPVGGLPPLPPLAGPESAPEPQPESPLAVLAAGLCDLLGKAATWLAERKL